MRSARERGLAVTSDVAGANMLVFCPINFFLQKLKKTLFSPSYFFILTKNLETVIKNKDNMAHTYSQEELEAFVSKEVASL